METARYFNKMFDAEIKESIQSDGRQRVDVNLGGLAIFIAAADDATPEALKNPHLGLDHFGLRVNNLEEAVAQLKERGAEFIVEPHSIRPGVSIAFVRTPDDVRIELLERS
jgi:catechol 2,3-dioxygenase-like lactoylglutathione lyase family enzyme